MRVESRHLRRVTGFLLSCNLLSAGCSSLIAYSGQDVSKLATQQQVHQSFGTPTRAGDDGELLFDEYRTRRKISEPTVAGVNFVLGAETLGLLELWAFPATLARSTWAALVGQTVRFEYDGEGEVRRVLIDGTPMDRRAELP